MKDCDPPDPRWLLLDAAAPRLLNRLSAQGVERVEFVAAFPQDAFSVWLCTQTDALRDALGTPDPLINEVQAILTDAGFSSDQVAAVRTTAQSQQTVDQDYEGSWFYAMR